jgi:D-alanyl-lipoteichoic acid acyltransferase DltB (MBOAT superfamily)
MILNLIINLAILIRFKYYDFFVVSFSHLFDVNPDGLLIKVILPVGISFYTFQALSYSIDVYRGKIVPTTNIVAFFAYVSFFPQLVAGPIERAANLLPQFLKKRSFNSTLAIDGMRQILWGLFKKIVIADNCAIYVDEVFNTYSTQSGSTLLLSAILWFIR